MEKGGGQIVSVLAAAFADMARAHAVAAVIEDAAGQQSLGVHPCGPMIGRLLTQLGLHGVEQVPIENAGLFAIEDLTLEWHLTDIEAIAQEVAIRVRSVLNCRAVGSIDSLTTSLMASETQ